MSNSLHIFLDRKRRLEDALVSLKFLMLMCSLSQPSWVLRHHKTMGRFHFSPGDLTAVLNPHTDSGSGGFEVLYKCQDRINANFTSFFQGQSREIAWLSH